MLQGGGHVLRWHAFDGRQLARQGGEGAFALLLQSTGFAAPKDAGQAIARLQQQGESALAALAGQLAPIEGVPAQDVAAALQQLTDAANA